jgi:hypothetical protein
MHTSSRQHVDVALGGSCTHLGLLEARGPLAAVVALGSPEPRPRLFPSLAQHTSSRRAHLEVLLWRAVH